MRVRLAPIPRSRIAAAAELPHWQRFFPGTTAWRISFRRRQLVEGVNEMLKGGFVNIQHKFFRVFGLTKMKLLLAFSVVGYTCRPSTRSSRRRPRRRWPT
jgi:hypothetical protein